MKITFFEALWKTDYVSKNEILNLIMYNWCPYCFQGGVSRKKFLSNFSKNYEKSQKNVYFWKPLKNGLMMRKIPPIVIFGENNWNNFIFLKKSFFYFLKIIKNLQTWVSFASWKTWVEKLTFIPHLFEVILPLLRLRCKQIFKESKIQPVIDYTLQQVFFLVGA